MFYFSRFVLFSASPDPRALSAPPPFPLTIPRQYQSLREVAGMIYVGNRSTILQRQQALNCARDILSPKFGPSFRCSVLYWGTPLNPTLVPGGHGECLVLFVTQSFQLV